MKVTVKIHDEDAEFKRIPLGGAFNFGGLCYVKCGSETALHFPKDQQSQHIGVVEIKRETVVTPLPNTEIIFK